MLEGAGGLLHREQGPQQRLGGNDPEGPRRQSLRPIRPSTTLCEAALLFPLAVGNGRHVRLLGDCGFAACAVDHDTTSLLTFAGPSCGVRRVDLETGEHWRSAASMMES
jgi:hypothetical protein